ncbi:hypothetical protein JCM10213v2_004641 [Rhodosporidiobolus nylandii]
MELPGSLPSVTRIFLTSAGRDAVLRLVQYTLRLAIYLRKRTLPTSCAVRLLAVVSSLAAIRRIVALRSLLSTLRSSASLRSGLLAWRRPSASDNPAHSAFSSGALLAIIRSLLETTATLTDSVDLFARLRILSLSPRTARRVDKFSDLAALASAVVGMTQVVRRRRAVYAAGRTARRRAVRAEKRVEELEFWSSAAKRKMSSEEQEEEKRLREEVRKERRTLRGLQGDLRELRWERLKVVAEGVFALYDTLDLETAAEGVKAWSGIVASIIEFSQAWAGHVALQAVQRRRE